MQNPLLSARPFHNISGPTSLTLLMYHMAELREQHGRGIPLPFVRSICIEFAMDRTKMSPFGDN